MQHQHRAHQHAQRQPLPAPPPSFVARKDTIVAQLAVPEAEYSDRSPKGSVDRGIRDLIDEINALDGFITTSSCAGRVSVFLEGRKAASSGGGPSSGGGSGALPADEGEQGEHSAARGGSPVETGPESGKRKGPAPATPTTVAGVGGKGGGGKWLFVSHDPLETAGKLDSEPNIVAALLGLEAPIFDGKDGAAAEDMGDEESRLIHFKFEPMILHILTASPQHAQLMLRCGLQAGFRESGAVNLLGNPATGEAATPIVAVRSMGLGFESLIGRVTNGTKHCNVSGEYLKALIRIANERFVENRKRIDRFRAELGEVGRRMAEERGLEREREGGQWKDAAVRKERKRAEGLRRAAEVSEARKLREQQEEEQEQEVGALSFEAIQ